MALPTVSAGPLPTSSPNYFDYSRVPPEVWKEILHKIEDPLTFQQSLKVCKGWHEILLNERTSQLFPSVLQQINEYLSLKDILSCRQVSQRWKNGVDNYLPLNLSWKRVSWRTFLINPEKERWVSPLGNTFYKTDQLTNFLTQMENCTSNPFPTRTLLFYHLCYPIPSRNGVQLQVQDKDELFTAFLSLLRKFGNQVWTFVYITDNTEDAPLQAWMQQILQLLPNLRKLRLEIAGEDPWALQVFNGGWDWFKYLQPLAPHLISLHVGAFYSSKVTGSILEAVGGQLEYLGCEASVVEEATYFGSPTHPWFIREMPNLRELKLTRVDGSRGDNEFQLLSRLARLRLPKLEKLWYDADKHGLRHELPIKAVLYLINQFAPTIQELQFTIPLDKMVRGENLEDVGGGEEDPEVVALLAVSLPKLKTLGLGYTMVDHLILDSVLDKCVNLERVRLHEFQVDHRDMRGNPRAFVLRECHLAKILKLNGMIKSTKFKSVELWKGDGGGCIHRWKRE